MNKIIGNQIIRIPSTESTNNYANHQIRQESINEGTVFLTYDQSAGRGLMNNSWESEPGKNLTFSIVLCPEFLEIRRQFMLSKVVSLGVYRAINKYVADLKIKWPNDIYVGNLKLGGILIENSIMSGLIKNSIIGIGINVNQMVFRSNAPNPVSLQLLTNQHYDVEQILSEVLEAIDDYYHQLKSGDFAAIDMDYLSALYRLNEIHGFNSENQEFQGEIMGVNEIGQLQIRKSTGELCEFHFKEVEFLHMFKD
jgi:BirA family transcriptional regulator, biotin operon repressor / biotin---[acetyl-CoA-carboxylase] ligase